MNYYFITGTSRGIGKALAEEILSQENTYVYGISRTSTIQHVRYKHFSIDLSNIEHVNSFQFDEISNATSVSLINNSGSLGEVKHVGNLNTDKITEAINLNVIAAMILSNKFLDAYRNRTVKKVILNISSGAGKSPVDGWSIYCASKAALDMFSKVIAEEQKLDDGNFNVFSVAPGVVDTQMQSEIRANNQADFSRISDFLDYKKDGILVDPRLVSKKLFRILLYPENFNEVILSVRDM